MTGLITPLCFPRIEIALINVAPVEPAENTACTFLSLSNCIHPTIDAFFLFLIALNGSSSIEITWGKSKTGIS